MEPVTATILGIFLWEALGEPLVDKVKEKYSEKVDDVLSNLLFNQNDKKVIKTEMLNCDQDILESKDNFLEYIEQSPKIQNVLKQNTYTFNKETYGPIIDKVEAGATINTTYNIGNTYNSPKS